jgi:hypothetical protein
MKKVVLTLSLCLFITLESIAQKQIFESPKLKSEIAKQKIVAILPFNVTISYKKQPKNFSAEGNHQQEIAYSTKIQASMYTFLLRKAGNYTVSFQDVEKTNILLKKAGINGDSDECDHSIPAQADHPFRAKLTRAFRGKLTTPNA